MSEAPVSVDRIRQAILLLRGQKVILDRDSAVLYGVPTKALKQAVKRDAGRFPEDFMFVLTREEFAEWNPQFVTSRADRMGLRHVPMAFTEQGIAIGRSGSCARRSRSRRNWPPSLRMWNAGLPDTTKAFRRCSRPSAN